ncbi:GmrSD restriction endonuclease domain-containing protein, partial [Burkholderia cenocepacia]
DSTGEPPPSTFNYAWDIASQKLNGSLSNAPWNKLPGNDVKTKRDALEEHSKLELNRLLLKTYVDWDEKAIAKRAEVLFEEARAIWPL